MHGKLTCESIYINSNTGEIKIGDIGIKHIYEMHEANDQTRVTSKSNLTAKSELSQCKCYLKEQNTFKFDAFCFGLALLEIVCSEMATQTGQHTFKFLNRVLNSGKRERILHMIDDL